MSRQLRRLDVIAALEASRDAQVLRYREALISDTRESFTVADSPADILRENLEIKYRIAKEKGKTLEGDEDLLLTLAGLGFDEVTGVFLDRPGEHVALFLLSSSLHPIGCVVLRDDTSN